MYYIILTRVRAGGSGCQKRKKYYYSLCLYDNMKNIYLFFGTNVQIFELYLNNYMLFFIKQITT